MINMQPTTEDDIAEALLLAKDVYIGEQGLQSTIEHSIRNRSGFALRDNNGHLGMLFGYVMQHAGVAHVWAITTPNLDIHPIAYTRVVRRALDNGMKVAGIHRVEINVRNSFEAGHRWAKALGFAFEGIMKQYGSDKDDYALYGRVR